MIDTILTYDATGGGTQLIVNGSSLTIKKDGHIVGYFADGISLHDITITNPNNTDWEAAGFKLPATSSGTALLGDDPYRLLTHKIPVKKNDTLVIVSTSGANPVYAGLYIDYGGFSPRKTLEAAAHLLTKATVAGGTNCAAGTMVQGATDIGSFGTGRTYTPVSVKANAAFSTTAFLGLRKRGGDNVKFIVPIPLTDVAANWKEILLPHGLFTCQAGDGIEVFWTSETGEQPTADVNFAY